MRKVLATAAVIFAFASILAVPVRAQSGTETEITFTQQKKEKARQQLRRILSEYDLDPWIFTQEVRIEAGVDPHSMPILTLNTNFLNSDEMQLEIFLHEQAHWFVHEADARDAAIEELRQLYSNPPSSASYRTYQHLLVAWLALDAMAELVGEEEARQISEAVVRKVIGESISEIDRIYRWYNDRVFEDTQEIGAIVAKHNMLITPEKGLVVEAGE